VKVGVVLDNEGEGKGGVEVVKPEESAPEFWDREGVDGRLPGAPGYGDGIDEDEVPPMRSLRLGRPIDGRSFDFSESKLEAPYWTIRAGLEGRESRPLCGVDGTEPAGGVPEEGIDVRRVKGGGNPWVWRRSGFLLPLAEPLDLETRGWVVAVPGWPLGMVEFDIG